MATIDPTLIGMWSFIQPNNGFSRLVESKRYMVFHKPPFYFYTDWEQYQYYQIVMAEMLLKKTFLVPNLAMINDSYRKIYLSEFQKNKTIRQPTAYFLPPWLQMSRNVPNPMCHLKNKLNEEIKNYQFFKNWIRLKNL